MPSDYAALCHDYYLNQRLSLKMDLQMRRDTVLSLFDRIRRARPNMDKFRRYSNELALESSASADNPGYQWLSVRKTSVRSGSVNHKSDADAHGLHRLLLEAAPFYLDITPLDVDYLEILFGFDLLAGGNHDAIVFNALLEGSPLGTLCDRPGLSPIDCQPIFGVSLTGELTGKANSSSDDSGEAEDGERSGGPISAYFEVKTRSGAGRGGRARSQPRTDGESRGRDGEHPISLYLVLRKHNPGGDVRDLPAVYNTLVAHGEELLERRIVPNLLVPIREAISTS